MTHYLIKTLESEAGRNTKSEASNAIPCLCAFILPIAQLKDNFFDAFFLLFPLCGAGSFKKSTGDSVDVLRNSFIFQFPRKFGTICSQASQYIRKRSTLGSQYIGNRKMRDLFHSVFHCKIAFHGFYLVSNQHLQEAPPSDLSRKSPNLTTPKIQT